MHERRPAFPGTAPTYPCPMKFLRRMIVFLYRLVVAFFALTGTFVTWTGQMPDNWFFFTHEMNFLAGLIFVWAAFATLLDGVQPPAWLKSGVTMALIVVGVVANTILPAPDLATKPHYFGIPEPWILHIIVPVLVVVDWFLADRHRRLKWHYSLSWLIYFLVYFAVILVRAHFFPTAGLLSPTDPYPYGFIDLTQHTPMTVATNAVLCLAAFFVLGLLLWAIDRLLPAKPLIDADPR
jgi:hypothetical protein